jgi:hypothetical protein
MPQTKSRTAERMAIVIRVEQVEQFIEQMVLDRPNIRHKDVFCTSSPADTSTRERAVFAGVAAAYILDDQDGTRVVELRYPCGRLAPIQQKEATAAYVLSVQAAACIKAAVLDSGLRWRVGRPSLIPPDGCTLRWYTVRTTNGERDLQADGPDHAREQHLDAFTGEPGEEILAIIYGDPVEPQP